MKKFSIVIPAYNESDNLLKLVKEITNTLLNNYIYEIIIVDDGSSDNTIELINKKLNIYSIILIQHKSNLGQSQSIYSGIKKASYDTIVTIDADGQNNPFDIPKLLKIYFHSDDIFLVGGIRKKRKDSIVKILSSKIANNVRLFILKDNCPDTGCSLKVFSKKIFLKFPYFNGIHRFLPAFFSGYGYKTFFIPVDHRSRIYGKSKYGTLDRLLRGIYDLFAVKNMINRNRDNND